MKAARVLQFGPPNVIMTDDLPRPEPGAGQLLVRVKAAGVGNWDALVRGGKIPNDSVVPPVPETAQKRYGIRAAYFYVDVTTTWLNKITELFESGKLTTDVGTVLPLEEARKAHELPRRSH